MLPQLRKTWGVVLRALSLALRRLKPPNKYLHYKSKLSLYFVVLITVSSSLLYVLGISENTISGIDAVFMACSAALGAGFNTVNLSTLNASQQTVMYCTIVLGHPIFISLAPIQAKIRKLQPGAKEYVRSRKMALQQSSSESVASRASTPSEPLGRHAATITIDDTQAAAALRAESALSPTPSFRPRLGSSGLQFESDCHVTRAESRASQLFRGRRPSAISHLSTATQQPAASVIQDDFRAAGYVDLHGGFHDLTSKGKDHTQFLECLFAEFLRVAIIFHLVFCYTVGALIMVPIIGRMPRRDGLDKGLNLHWVGFFLVASSFTNTGLTLVDQNMVPFQQEWAVLGTMALLILAGNTLHPVIMYGYTWCAYKILTSFQQWSWAKRWTKG